jgi:RHS repeat-associated protein
MYDSHGTPTWSCELSSYGEVRNITGTRGDCPFRYQGQYEDVETGLYYNRFRYYDPNIGNYLSQDPIGLAGGNPTLYGYVGDTNSWVDVFGLSCKPTKYHKRSVAEVAKLRNTFEKSGGVRAKYLKKLAKDPNAVSKYGEGAVEKMKKGEVPDNMVVHHKKPLFRGGNNKYDNLDLLDKSTHSSLNKDLHWYPEGQNPYSLN